MRNIITRRILLLGALTGAVLPARRSDAIVTKLDPTEPKAKALGYVEDAIKVPVRSFPNFRQGQTCANCALVQSRYGPVRPCTLFPGKMIKAKGWCSAWVARTFKK